MGVPLNNSVAVVVLSLILGAAAGISYVGAESYLLATVRPVYAAYASVAGGAALWVLVRFIQPSRMKFARFAVGLMGVYTGALVLLSTELFPAPVRAVLWFFFAIFGYRGLRWMVSLFVIRHLDPARAQTHLWLLIATYEGGMFIPLLLLREMRTTLSPTQIILVTAGLAACGLFLIAYQFLPARNFEVHFSHKEVEQPQLTEARSFKTLALMLSLLTFYFGIFKFSEEYLIRIVLKEKLGSYQAIQHALAGYRLLGNAMIVAVGLYVARRMRKSHTSPILVLAGTMAALLAVATATATTQKFGFFAALEIARWVGENGFYYLGIQMLLASFTGAFQAKLARKWHLFFYPIAGVPLVLLFYFSDLLMSSRQEHLLLGIVIVSLVCALASVLTMHKSLTATLYAFAASGHKAAAVIAVNALSYLRPRGYEEALDRILALAPKKILRKHIILALGQSPERRSIDRIIREFESEQEEIQIAVVEALQISRNYKAGQFLNRVTQAQIVRPKTIRVRINAAMGLAAMYGRFSIPFLLVGLEDEDPRIVANTLETLSGFRDRKLIPWFQQFAGSSNPRVRANALMGLAAFRGTRETYRAAIREILAGDDLATLSSALYVLGRVEDHTFTEELQRLAAGPKSEQPQIRRCLAWALIRLHDPLGYELFDRILASGEAPGFMHFFAQLASETRMDLVRHVATSSKGGGIILRLQQAMQERTFDFHEELDFLLLLARK
jgi:hypothetical protein